MTDFPLIAKINIATLEQWFIHLFWSCASRIGEGTACFQFMQIYL